MNSTSALHELRLWLGIERDTTSHGEKWISGMGALLGILSVYWITRGFFPQGFTGTPGGMIMLTSLGASAVLLFAVPHGALSQPWAVVGGHLISATIGVTCQKLFSDQSWTPALAVGMAVGTMHYLRCIHPPGGATALAAVIGGSEVHSLGYQFLLTPVFINVMAILLMAVAYNAMFAWRRYPAHHHKRKQPSSIIQPAQRQFEITQEDLYAAMEQLNSYVDITSESLTDLLELARQHAERNVTHPKDILDGRYYSNGKLGKAWSIRLVRSSHMSSDMPPADMVSYEVSAGDDLHNAADCSAQEFRQWARFEVQPQGKGRWVKADGDA